MWGLMLDTWGVGSDAMLLDVGVCAFGVMLGAGIFMVLYLTAGRKLTLSIGCFGLMGAAGFILADVVAEGVLPVPHLSSGMASTVAQAAAAIAFSIAMLAAVEMAPTVVRTTTAGYVVASMAGGAAVANARVQSAESVALISLSAIGVLACVLAIFIMIIMPGEMQWKLSHRHPFRRQIGAGFTELPVSVDEEDCEVDGEPQDIEDELYSL